MPKISIIVPIYNAEKVLKRCVDSILNQSYKNFELILINDGSKDKTKEILDQYYEYFVSHFGEKKDQENR